MDEVGRAGREIAERTLTDSVAAEKLLPAWTPVFSDHYAAWVSWCWLRACRVKVFDSQTPVDEVGWAGREIAERTLTDSVTAEKLFSARTPVIGDLGPEWVSWCWLRLSMRGVMTSVGILTSTLGEMSKISDGHCQ